MSQKSQAGHDPFSRYPFSSPRSVSFEDDASLEIVFKIQETCNINCTYCYMYNVGNELFKDMPSSSPIDVCENVASFICATYEERCPSYIRLILHGGEPMLMPAHRLDERLRAMHQVFQHRLSEEQIAKLQITLQTNATLVSDEWINVMESWKIHPSVSIDGPKYVHDKYRVDKKARGTYSKVIAGIDKLQRAANEGKIGEIGALAVIDGEVSGATVYRHLVDDLGFNRLDFLFPFMNWSNYNRELASGISRYVADAFREWLFDISSGKRVAVRVFDRAIWTLRELENQMPVSNELRLKHQIVIVESDGTIMPEESLRPTYTGRYANIHVSNETPSSIRLHPKFDQLEKAQKTWSTECHGCALLGACKSGSSLGRIGMRIDADGGTTSKPVYCDSYIQLYAAAAAAAFGSKRNNFVERLISEEPQLTTS